MDQSSVPHTQISLRLAILSEFLLDEEKPIKELYGSWMRRVGGPIIEFSEFEYWYRRFKNNQFDLGYDTSQDQEKVDRIQKKMNPKARGVQNVPAMIIKKKDEVEVEEGKIQDSELDHLFDEKHVPLIFQKMISLKKIELHFHEENYTMKLDEKEISWEKRENGWMINYKNVCETITTDDPEKSIIDHLWFVLKNPNIKLEHFGMEIDSETETTLDFERLSSLSKLMFDSIDHQIHTANLWLMGFDEDTFLSILRHFQPKTLLSIVFALSWKGKGNYQKLDEIVNCDQWKQALRILSPKESPFKIEDLLHCKVSLMTYDNVTPELVLRAYKYLSSFGSRNSCDLICKNKNLDIDAIMDAIRSQNDGAEICGMTPQFHLEHFRYKIMSRAYTGCYFLYGNSFGITIKNYS